MNRKPFGVRPVPAGIAFARKVTDNFIRKRILRICRADSAKTVSL